MAQSDYRLVELSQANFATFTKNTTCQNFLQSTEMFSRYQTTKKEAYLVGLADSNNTIVVAALVVKISESMGEKIFSMPGGPLIDFDSDQTPELLTSFTRQIKHFLKTKHGAVLLINPNTVADARLSRCLTSAGLKDLGEYLYPKWVAILNLAKITDMDTYFASLRKTHRQNIKKATERYGLTTRELNVDELQILEELCAKSGQRHGFLSQRLNYFTEMKQAFGDKIKFLCAFYDKTPIAAAMFVLYGDEIIYLYSGTDSQYRKYCGSYAIQWWMINYAWHQNYKTYNFYGVRPSADDGVFQFKLGFRASLVEKAGTFALPLNLIGKTYLLDKRHVEYGKVQ